MIVLLSRATEDDPPLPDTPLKKAGQRRMSGEGMTGDEAAPLPMSGIREHAHQHAFYVRDALGSPHFSEAKREATMLLLAEVLKAKGIDLGDEYEDLIEGSMKKEGEDRRSHSRTPSREEGSAHDGKHSARKKSVKEHEKHHGHEKKPYALEGFIQLRVLHESEAPPEVSNGDFPEVTITQ